MMVSVIGGPIVPWFGFRNNRNFILTDSSYPNLSTPPTVTIIDATQEAEDELEQDHGESVGHEEELPLSPGEVPDESEVPDEPEIPDESIKPAPPPPSDQIEMPPAPPPVIIMDGPKIKMKFHCFFCQRVFVEKKTLVKHQENVCTHSICTQAHQHQVISFDFDTMMEAINWILSQELDQFYATHVSK